ncbi:MAG: 16S rRNA (adenine(1518)-N(6)/adenine(1519)-N(6))-dimethyltransferase RsmA [Gallionella sp.]|nr:16S rRNA (adenine(1518)-N(6)/adenine(1519)-N(6))-dimethyltransferase RsmA [Gallionella sp.]PIR09633.1 MAG: 16S rRNA (adenine(1518)-N(6)/adenine(1519)-N(6))-dimethyltransferase [Gallionellaceae bacterium CG11_big_fil_rev_8_21_14_0_20_60_62]PIV47976.1 MAG: 16S rRNA (adenine(1518)-N(6)/adenine(1519)-N(6))-dimethyltransferase [Gallionellaceae bacterium CG02_land_8_20_14_3_00_60_115]PIY06822.1 MAG: 16S rRNA (adenine(1518)-N(6)/adenine(1519)-N(6))-dimethyltransferase [Gallionellaceae bacterium CG_4
MSGHKAKKQFGQNFLVDQTVIADIVRSISPQPNDHMVEIGPGLGALTRPLLQHLHKLHLVEIDRDIIARLKTDYPQDTIVIHEGDALQFDFSTLDAPLRIVGNLPYNISSPLLFHFAAFAARITDMHFMLQNEVVERMVAAPSTPQYGRLSVMLQYRFEMEKLLDVPPQSFRPAPKVDSAIVRMIPLPADRIQVRNEGLFARAVAAAFGQRRKTLRNTLKAWLAEADFARLGIDAQLRAENLGVAEFTRIANLLNERGAV